MSHQHTATASGWVLLLTQPVEAIAATVEYWPDFGHSPHLVDPDRFVARLRDFWMTAPAQTSA